MAALLPRELTKSRVGVPPCWDDVAGHAQACLSECRWPGEEELNAAA
jgi:hypothetical protein